MSFARAIKQCNGIDLIQICSCCCFDSHNDVPQVAKRNGSIAVHRSSFFQVCRYLYKRIKYFLSINFMFSFGGNKIQNTCIRFLISAVSNVPTERYFQHSS